MVITLEERTADSVRIYFERANQPAIKQVLPQKAKTIEEALEDYEESLLPDATSFGQTVYVDGKYIGDVWCYGIDLHRTDDLIFSLKVESLIAGDDACVVYEDVNASAFAYDLPVCILDLSVVGYINNMPPNLPQSAEFLFC